MSGDDPTEEENGDPVEDPHFHPRDHESRGRVWGWGGSTTRRPGVPDVSYRVEVEGEEESEDPQGKERCCHSQIEK